jgi:two-component system response regulator HydG
VTGRVLIVDDDEAMCETLEADLGPRGFDVRTATSAADALEALAGAELDVVVTDLNMRGMNGLELCERVVGTRSDIPVLVITAFGSLDTAIAAMRAGAYDFLTKPVETDVLALALERAIQHRRLREEVKRLREVVDEAGRFGELLGASPAMRRVHGLLERIAGSDASVLVTGETGTGKELAARALHERSRRRTGPFVAINCAAMPEPLLESELFGHARGAFTDARTARTGLLVQANGGTLLLDEIGDMPLALQPKLLRALQERTARPVGGDTEIPFDARIVATTNRDLDAAAEEGRFREDLYFRINVIHVEMPPLRARGSDVLLLAQHLLRRCATAAGKQITGFSHEAAKRLLAYSWPGNVRELANCVEHAVALALYDQIGLEDLPEKIVSYHHSHVVVAADDPSELAPLEEVERRYILRVLETVGGNKTIAARVLGVGRKTLYRKLEQYAKPAGRSPA